MLHGTLLRIGAGGKVMFLINGKEQREFNQSVLRNLTVMPRDEPKSAPRKVAVDVKKKPTPIIIETGEKKKKKKLVVQIRQENGEKVSPYRYIEDYLTQIATENTVWNKIMNGRLTAFVESTYDFVLKKNTNANMIKIKAYLTDY
jgi:hypothetical protein